MDSQLNKTLTTVRMS